LKSALEGKRGVLLSTRKKSSFSKNPTDHKAILRLSPTKCEDIATLAIEDF
jgi:hypothetical protein